MGTKIALYYLLAINTISFLIFALDKYQAVRHRARISEATLLGLTIIGGSLGGLLGMYICRHKIRKKKFVLGIPLIFVVQLIGGYFVGGRL
ncbi:uncharacterized membrane protein YsdA (DUF1294 family) [Lachnospiraceae bacterium PF1-21]|uniref:DUF1294 domain-containing protein n=1 Tax=Ohessyouella blattaphilus TaxID=2949333 RepID=UPI00255D783D|nr:DUF1294 domain-containing protein [Lachnospiraceae bacterium OttesenSCG-928-J05]